MGSGDTSAKLNVTSVFLLLLSCDRDRAAKGEEEEDYPVGHAFICRLIRTDAGQRRATSLPELSAFCFDACRVCSLSAISPRKLTLRETEEELHNEESEGVARV